jgi:hypothetical protein
MKEVENAIKTSKNLKRAEMRKSPMGGGTEKQKERAQYRSRGSG